MATNKTSQTAADVDEFLGKVENQTRKNDSLKLLPILERITGCQPRMWGPSIVGFGSFHYKYKSGHEGDAPLAAFSPRKDSLVLYVDETFKDREQLLEKLGKCKTSKACIYVKKLDDIDLNVYETIVRNCIDHVTELYGTTSRN